MKCFLNIQTITLPEEKQVNGFFSKSFIKNKFFYFRKKGKTGGFNKI